MIYENINEISIYTGGKCNFDCNYCDRSSISEIGYQEMKKGDVPLLTSYIMSVSSKIKKDLKYLSFHGGEPLLSIRMIDMLLEDLLSKGYVLPTIFFQTNGSLILKNKWFFDKWRDKCFVSISYDFMFQDINRKVFDIEETLNYLNGMGIETQLQHVMPSNNPRAFTWDHLKSILDIKHKYQITRFSLIILRHMRGGKDNFRPIINEIGNIEDFVIKVTSFIGALYANGCCISLDGLMKDDIKKDYFVKPQYIVLGPDGGIYPDYDFVEYKITNSVYGNWKHPNLIPIKELESESKKLYLPECEGCPSFEMCGLKYLHKLSSTPVERPDLCSNFYLASQLILTYNNKLKSKASLLHHMME